ncbi:hypothetical protein HPB47_006700, partial [Ixodes persulcatus]
MSMNADGSPIFKSANYSIWPIQLTLNELPPCLRWRSPVLPLLWYGSKHPNMTLLLQAFSTQMAHLAQQGITWSTGSSTVNSKQAIVSERLCKQKPPQCMNRPPRALKLRKYWKAAEWQSWLFYYCLPCVEGILPDEYFAHFELFTSALYLLTKTEVRDEDVDLSTEKMTKFVVLTEFLYGKANMTSNVHTLLHLPKAVLLHGPLWALSCFQFESGMGHLLKLASSSNGVPFQILSRILLRNNFLKLRSMVSDEVRAHFSTRKRAPQGVHLFGKPRQLPECVLELVEGVALDLKEYDR